MGTSNNEYDSRLGSILGDLHFVKLPYIHTSHIITARLLIRVLQSKRLASCLNKRNSLNVGGDSINIRILILETH